MAETGERSGGARRPQVLSGMRDFLPQKMLLRQHVMGVLRRVFEAHGFEPLDTPAIEYLETLQGKYGEDEKLIYRFQDHGERWVGLRYDLTIPLARVVAMRQNDIVLPFKRYHMAPVWRADRPQKGRYREFWQCDVDTVGSRSMVADAEMLQIVGEALDGLGFRDFVTELNHRLVLSSLARYAGVTEHQTGAIIRAVDKLAKIGPDGVREEMLRAGIAAEAAERVLQLVLVEGDNAAILAELVARLGDMPEAAPGLQDLSALLPVLRDLGVPDDRVRLTLSLARGLDYYTGPVHETVVREPKVGSIAGGGRYDGLVGVFSGREMPATGVSLGLERLLDVIEDLHLLQPPATVTEVLVTVFGADGLADSLRLANDLRAAGLRCEVYLEPRRRLGDQLAYANRRQVPLAVILGPDEVARGEATLRRLSDGHEWRVPLARLAETARQALVEVA
ncbi:MAG: histidine--tRNA ligase [Chloroflexi bacterium]|nr:histidine--tRNA ligase [Chloroflexota bacterium]